MLFSRSVSTNAGNVSSSNRIYILCTTYRIDLLASVGWSETFSFEVYILYMEICVKHCLMIL